MRDELKWSSNRGAHWQLSALAWLRPLRRPRTGGHALSCPPIRSCRCSLTICRRGWLLWSTRCSWGAAPCTIATPTPRCCRSSTATTRTTTHATIAATSRAPIWRAPSRRIATCPPTTSPARPQRAPRRGLAPPELELDTTTEHECTRRDAVLLLLDSREVHVRVALMPPLFCERHDRRRRTSGRKTRKRSLQLGLCRRFFNARDKNSHDACTVTAARCSSRGCTPTRRRRRDSRWRLRSCGRARRRAALGSGDARGSRICCCRRNRSGLSAIATIRAIRRGARWGRWHGTAQDG